MKKARQIVAILILALITLYFLDFTGTLPHSLHVLEHLQIIPAILASGFIIVAVLLVCSLLFGRIYCSVICPLGLFQDFSWRVAKFFNKKKRFRYVAENKILRWLVLGIFVICLILNAAFLVGLIEPYSIFGRIMTHVFRPVYWSVNNLIAFVFNAFGNYSFYRVEIYVVSVSSLIIALVSLGVIFTLSFRQGRIYCNTFCPVGTGLGYLSKIALFKIRIDDHKCNSCGLCAMKCKSSCIDSKTHQIDYSRCVSCYNCVSECRSHAISYTRKPVQQQFATQSSVSDARRRFFTMSSLLVVSALKAKAQNVQVIKGKTLRLTPIVPPGGTSPEHLLKYCTACHLCVSKCPARVIKPAFMEYGAAGIMLPMMTYEKGFCNFDCTICSNICPSKALSNLTQDEKHRLKIGNVHFELDACIVYTDNTSCGACSEHCPTQAVSMVDYQDGLTIPHIKQELCVGCGGCESICPSIPNKAIYIEGLSKHQQAVAIEKESIQVFELEDFGF